MKYNVAEKWIKCTCCGEQVRTGERYITSEIMRGKYCEYCEGTIHDMELENNNLESRGERDRETFAAYKTAGAVASYFDDMV